MTCVMCPKCNRLWYVSDKIVKCKDCGSEIRKDMKVDIEYVERKNKSNS